jgi:hypothetical protein
LKAATVSHSSTEAEIKALDEAVRQCIWLRGFLYEIGYQQLEPTTIYVDNISAKIMTELYRITNNSSHIVMRLNFIHQEIKNGTITLKYIDSQNEIADILTKLLPQSPFIKLRKILLYGHNNIEPNIISKFSKVSNKKVLFAKIRKQMIKNQTIKYV